ARTYRKRDRAAAIDHGADDFTALSIGKSQGQGLVCGGDGDRRTYCARAFPQAARSGRRWDNRISAEQDYLSPRNCTRLNCVRFVAAPRPNADAMFARPYSPFQFGLRFSANARGPSIKSCELKSF